MRQLKSIYKNNVTAIYAYISKDQLKHFVDKLSEEHLKGILVAPWLWTTRDNAHGLLCDAERFYYGRKESGPSRFNSAV